MGILCDYNVPKHDEDVYGDVACPQCESYDIVIVSTAVYKSHVGVHNAIDSEYSYVATNSSKSIEIDKETERFTCTSCQYEWPLDGTVYWEWYE
jgi:transposase-like protein